jgi:hypothetical protein
MAHLFKLTGRISKRARAPRISESVIRGIRLLNFGDRGYRFFDVLSNSRLMGMALLLPMPHRRPRHFPITQTS